MRGLTKRWRFREQVESPAESIVGLPPLVHRVLAARGFCEHDSIQRFCQPKLTDLHDPGLLPNIDTAVVRLIDAIKRDEHIAIYGDYDVDGICASAILFHIIKTIRPAARVQTYVPHRLEEGYGLNCDALRQLRAGGAQLAITVDCGVTAILSAKTACQIGLDLIITDHHGLKKVGDTRAITGLGADDVELPDAHAVVHPALPGSAYPFQELCGAGVAFKLAWRLATTWCNSQRVSESLQKALIDMLPLAALATIADVVPLTGENRVLTWFGLRFIRQTPLVGLRTLIEVSNLMDEKIDSHKVGFVLGPRLNACGRMGHAAEAVKLLTDVQPDEAVAIARNLTQLNQHRQSVERTIVEQALRLAEDRGMTRDDCRAIVLAHENWHAGVVGIACSRLVERFSRPVVLLQKLNDICKGSARSIDGYSIHAGLSAAAEHLTTFGGHDMAAGLSLAPDRLELFTRAFTEHANLHIGVESLLPELTLDCQASGDELSVEAVQRLHAMAPFGRGNRSPSILLPGMTLAEAPKQIGPQGRHLSLRTWSETNRTRRWLRSVWWHGGKHAADLAPGMRLDLAVEPKINAWDGRVNVEAEICDLRVAAGALAPVPLTSV
jgi:single-stranded-DNA-specific exonuclease